MLKELVVVVVRGLFTELIVIGTLVADGMEMALMLMRMEEVLETEQVELMLQVQVEVPLTRLT